MATGTSRRRRLKGTFRRLIAYVLPVFVFGMAARGCECKPPETVDKPASELGVSISVSDPEEHPPDNNVLVIVQFFSGGKVVYLASNAGVYCNGVSLPEQALSYMARVPIAPAGGNYNIVHKRGGVNTAVNIAVPQRPVFISPTEGATVARVHNLTITYVPGSASEITGRASGHSTGGTISRTADGQPDDGTYSGLSTAAFDAGPGRLSLKRKYLNIHSGGAGFESAKSTYYSGSRINVTWQ